jgi:large repetitive protein
MRRGTRGQGLAVLVAVLGSSLAFSAAVSAETPLTITFTSSPPSPAVAGGDYVVTATSSSGEPVQLYPGGACSFTKPGSEDQIEVRRGREKQPARKPHLSPQTVFLVGAGTCKIQTQTDASQSFTVTKDAAERINFATHAPSHPVVGGLYNPRVRSSARVDVSFAVATRSVCKIKGALVTFRAAGTCTIDVRQAGSSESEGPEARQSFMVSTREDIRTKKPSARQGA